MSFEHDQGEHSRQRTTDPAHFHGQSAPDCRRRRSSRKTRRRLFPSFDCSEPVDSPPAARRLERRRGRLPTISRLFQKSKFMYSVRSVSTSKASTLLSANKPLGRMPDTPSGSCESRIVFPMHLDVWLPLACFRPSLPVLAPEHGRVVARHERALRIPSPRRCCSRNCWPRPPRVPPSRMRRRRFAEELDYRSPLS